MKTQERNSRDMKTIMKLCILLGLSVLGFAGCGQAEEKNAASYQSITQEEAKEIMASDEDYIIVDVRTTEEYDTGHIPGAICIPNESIGNEEITQLPDKEQVILVYCRSGNRSRQASDKLAKMGYTNIREFGGINDWDGEIEK
jgi:phage shock protein E